MKADTRKDPSDYIDQDIEFFDTPGVDRLFSICMILAEELAVANETIDTLKQVLAQKGLVTAAELDDFEPDQITRQNRSDAHQILVRRILSSIETELNQLEAKVKKG